MVRPNHDEMRRGFSLLEILLALVFVSFSFLPIYNLFRFGQVGAKSNVKEVEATNYASDLVNFLRNMNYTEVSTKVGSGDDFSYDGDSAIKAVFPSWDLETGDGYTRSLVLRRFPGVRSGFLKNLLDSFIFKRRAVPNFLAEVKVNFKKPAGGDDEILICTIIMD
jgi:hypothetical protein